MIDLKMDHPSVPQPLRHFYWDLKTPVPYNTRRLEAQFGVNERFLTPGAKFDEAAVLVPGDSHRRSLHAQLTADEAGWEKFNEAEDLVYANPFGTRYSVEYWFYRHPEKNWRLEVMKTTGGISPLHYALPRMVGGLFPVPHLSFKPVRRELRDLTIIPSLSRLQTWQGAYSETVQHIKDQAGIHAQTCQSTYGVFSYWLPNDAQFQLYVKPRINVRDEGQA